MATRVVVVSSSSPFLPSLGVTKKLSPRQSFSCSYPAPVPTLSALVPRKRVLASKKTVIVTMATAVEEKLGIRIERNVPQTRLSELGIHSWPKWGCPPSKFPWTYDAQETCYLLKGSVKVYTNDPSDYVQFGAGDVVVFPAGMSCTWDVSVAVDKHYKFEW